MEDFKRRFYRMAKGGHETMEYRACHVPEAGFALRFEILENWRRSVV